MKRLTEANLVKECYSLREMPCISSITRACFCNHLIFDLENILGLRRGSGTATWFRLAMTTSFSVLFHWLASSLYADSGDTVTVHRDTRAIFFSSPSLTQNLLKNIFGQREPELDLECRWNTINLDPSHHWFHVTVEDSDNIWCVGVWKYFFHFNLLGQNLGEIWDAEGTRSLLGLRVEQIHFGRVQWSTLLKWRDHHWGREIWQYTKRDSAADFLLLAVWQH